MATPSRAVQIAKFCKREIPQLTDPELSGLGHALLAARSTKGFKSAKNEEKLDQHYQAVLAECEKRIKAVEKEARKIPDMTLQNLSDLEELARRRMHICRNRWISDIFDCVGGNPELYARREHLYREKARAATLHLNDEDPVKARTAKLLLDVSLRKARDARDEGEEAKKLRSSTGASHSLGVARHLLGLRAQRRYLGSY